MQRLMACLKQRNATQLRWLFKIRQGRVLTLLNSTRLSTEPKRQNMFYRKLRTLFPGVCGLSKE